MVSKVLASANNSERNSYIFPFHRRSRSMSPPKEEETKSGPRNNIKVKVAAEGSAGAEKMNC